MGRQTSLEPAPTQFYAPIGLFSDEELAEMGAVWLGEVILSPGCCFQYWVRSGPLCRLYQGKDGKLEPYALLERLSTG